MPTLESVVDASNLALFCTPAINLFREARRPDPRQRQRATNFTSSPTGRGRWTSRSTRSPSVVGHGVGDRQRAAVPAVLRGVQHRPEHRAVRRTSRRGASRGWCRRTQKRRGSRSSYIGSEVFLSLVDATQAPFSGDLRQLSIQTLCTNRDLVLQMPIGLGPTDFSLDIAAPVTAIRVVSGPSRPYAPLADGAVVVARDQPSVAELSVARATRPPEQGAAALRDLLELYAASTDVSARRQIEGIRSVRVGRVVRRLRGPRSARVRPRPRDHARDRRAGVRGRQRVTARLGARSLLRAPRVDQLVHRNRAAVGRARARSIDGCHTGARDRRSSVLRRRWPRRRTATTSTRRCGGWSACTTSSRAGDARCVRSTSRCASDRIRTCRSRRRRSRRSIGRDGAAAAAAGRGCSGCSGRTARCRCTSPNTRASGCAMRTTRR